jgi:predicted TIM-barrel fold metal-dependent hydrolase
VLPRFPETRWVVVESAVGYMPFVLECADAHFSRYQTTGYDMFEALPSEYFHRQVFGTYWFEKLDQHVLDRVGANNVMFETDYPHPTCLLRDEIIEAANEGLAGIDPEDRQKILWQNAASLYGIKDIPPTPTVAR